MIAQQKGKTQILVQAQGLTPSTQTTAYQVWLYDSPSKRKSLGATATDTSGNLQVVGTLPADYQKWKYIDVSSVTVTGSGSSRSVKNGASVLRGQLKLADKPVETGTGANKATVLAQIPLLPLPNSARVDGIQPDALLRPAPGGEPRVSGVGDGLRRGWRPAATRRNPLLARSARCWMSRTRPCWPRCS